ncbi:MAG: hypothetical protein LBG15_02030 [Dysgonamonadaceae bacterium]|jgi:hypothetical protein|nr:hypothetical protein [Dysgonamonadaceae bacterium]
MTVYSEEKKIKIVIPVYKSDFNKKCKLAYIRYINNETIPDAIINLVKHPEKKDSSGQRGKSHDSTIFMEPFCAIIGKIYI